MSKFYISHTSFNAIKSLPKKSSMRKLLETLSASTELSSFRWRQGEKTVLAKYNKVRSPLSVSPRLPIDGGHHRMSSSRRRRSPPLPTAYVLLPSFSSSRKRR